MDARCLPERVMRQVRKFLALSWRERWLVLKAFGALVVVRVALLTMSFSRVRSGIREMARGARDAGARPTPQQVARAVVACSALVPGGRNCLVRALATEILLARLGYHSELKIGAGKLPDGSFEAHAWLESEGKILVGEFELGRYAEMGNASHSRP